MKRVLQVVLMLLVSAPAYLRAQQPENQSAEVERIRDRARQEVEQRDWETKLFQIKYVDPNELSRALGMFRSNITYSGGTLRVLSVRAPKEIMPAIEDAIKRLDVPTPRRDAELTIHVLLGGNRSDAAPPTPVVPASLQPVVNQLKNLFPYKTYQLVDTLVARGRDTNLQTQTSLTGTLAIEKPFPGNITYSFRANLGIQNPDGKEPVLRLTNMRFTLTVPINAQGNTSNLEINTDVEIPRGQQVVVGKATYNDQAFILVMTSKFD